MPIARMGYLPAALRNYLVRLGWSHGDQEIFSTEEMIAGFDLPQIGRSPARFDFAKLESINGHYIRATSDERLAGGIDQLLPHLADGEALAAKLTPTVGAACCAAHAEPEGARENADRSHRRARAFFSRDRPLALTTRRPRC